MADGRSAPATGGDILCHIVSGRPDLNFELAVKLVRELGATVECSKKSMAFVTWTAAT